VLVLYTKDRFGWDTGTFLYFRLAVFLAINIGQFIIFPVMKKVNIQKACVVFDIIDT
jgi:hypothetical protein